MKTILKSIIGLFFIFNISYSETNFNGGSVMFAPYVVTDYKNYETYISLSNSDNDSMFMYKVSLVNSKVVTNSSNDKSVVVNFYIYIPPHYNNKQAIRIYYKDNNRAGLEIDSSLKIYNDVYYTEVENFMNYYLGDFSNGYLAFLPILEVDLNDDIYTDAVEISSIGRSFVNALYDYISDATFEFNSLIPNDSDKYGLLAGKAMRRVGANAVDGKLIIKYTQNKYQSVSDLQIYNNVISTDTVPSSFRLDGFNISFEHFLGADYLDTLISQIVNQDTTLWYSNYGKDEALILSFINNSTDEHAMTKAIEFRVYDNNLTVCEPATTIETEKTQIVISVDKLLTDLGCSFSQGKIVITNIYTKDTLHLPTLVSKMSLEDLGSSIMDFNLDYINYNPNNYIYTKPDISKVISNSSNGWSLKGTSYYINENLKDRYNLESVWSYKSGTGWVIDPAYIEENSGFWINKAW